MTKPNPTYDTVIHGQKKALELAVSGAPLSEILDVLVRTVESQSTSDILCSILLLDDDGQHLRHGAAPSLPVAYNSAIDGIAIGPDIGSCGTAAFTGNTIVVSDVQTDPKWAAFKGLAGEHGLRACWSMPIRAATGTILGTFAIYHRVVATPTPSDLETVELCGHTAAVVIERELHARRRAAAEAELRRVHEQERVLTAAITEQCRETEKAILDMRAAKESAEKRVAELERERAESV